MRYYKLLTTVLTLTFTLAQASPVFAEGAPVCDFFAVPTVGWDIYCAPEFVSTSTGWITDYLWEFGDGQWSTDPAPHHKYGAAGLYTVKLTVAGPCGSASVTKENYINIKDYAGFPGTDYVLNEPNFAAFDAALYTIEATNTPYGLANYPEWCIITAAGNDWCAPTAYGGGGRILFNFSNATIYGNWDTRIDPRGPGGNSNYKRDFFGDNLIIDGEDKNITLRYNGAQPCDQTENKQALRLHGCDNIVKNIRLERFPDGIHMRMGMRMLIEGITTMEVCEDAVSANGMGGSCVDCVVRDCTFGPSEDKTLMNSAAAGRRDLAPGRLVVSSMHSTGGAQPIRQGSNNRRSMIIVRNSTFLGDSMGPRFGGNQNLFIFENNYSSINQSGQADIRVGEQVRGLLRNNVLANSPAAYGFLFISPGAFIRAENNIIKGNTAGGIRIPTVPSAANCVIDLGGGLVNVYANGMVTGPTAVPVPSIGRNTIMGNGGYDLINQLPGTPKPVIKAENNFWDHTDVASVLSSDVSGAADVDPLGIGAVTYNGDMLLSTAGSPTVNANLVASLRDNAGRLLDIDGEQITFTLTADGIATIVATAYTQDGVATAVQALEPAIYTVRVTLGCSSVTAILVVFNPEDGFATGGGWILPVSDGENTHPDVRANFGFNAKYEKDGNLTGNLEFKLDGYIDLKSTSINQLVITGGRIAQLNGWASVNGQQGYWFFVKTVDNGEPGSNDTFEIKVWAPGANPQSSSPIERAAGVLQGGNIQVHTK